ncbi:cell wall metabolism sensor histidine kinase WalK [Kineosporia sp. A_224]|uniref:sensor histidine kinase n=1 Tax=Kineosporia sp. A_224 TaxID=1962180 RepID=UPI0013044488|nr:HAMP domain-containing sensor histidine kinase [Kineosporia sp. A_224]
MLLLSAAGMAVAGGVFTVVQRRQVRDDAIRTVTADSHEFRQFIDGDRAGADVATLLEAALERQVPTEHETFLALVDERPRFVPTGRRPVRLEDEPAVMAVVRSLAADAPTKVRTVDTSGGPVVFTALQVRVSGRPEVGTLVVAVAVGPATARVEAAARQYALLSALSLIAVGTAGWVVAGRLLLPLRRLRSAAEDLSARDLSRRVPVSGRDDVSALARTVNAMLDRLQTSFEVQQTFLDDAGHELRTPLTIVRGHLEVLDTADRQDVDQTRDLVLDELDRMSRLVDDLIVLAKAGRPDFVRTRPTDLDQLVIDAVEKAAALGRRRWTVDALTGRTAVLDPQRITQALLQLAVNAVQHTTQGEEIGVGAAVGSGTVQLWVRDSGPGVPPDEADRIFERFSGTGEGSGLGLSIVTSIAAAHGGTVSVGDAPAGGAVFTIRLPGVALVPAASTAPPTAPARAPARAGAAPAAGDAGGTTGSGDGTGPR